MTFTTPEFGASGKLVYAYLTYNLTSCVCYTFINIPYCALGGVITRDEEGSPFSPVISFYDLISGRSDGFCRNPCSWWIFFGKENKQFGFQATMGIMGAHRYCNAGFLLLLYKERVAPAVEQQGSIREDLRQLLANDQWRIVAIITFFSSMAGVMRSAATLYYATYLMLGGVESAAGTAMKSAFVSTQRRWHDYRQHRRRMAGAALSRGIAV